MEQLDGLFKVIAGAAKAKDAEIARLTAEVDRLKRERDHRTVMQAQLRVRIERDSDTAWNDAIEAAASVCDSKSGTPMDVREPEYYTALGYELAAEDIRALKRQLEKEGQ